MVTRNRWVIPIAEIPEDTTTQHWIYAKTDFLKQVDRFKSFVAKPFYEVKLSFDEERLRVSVLEAIKIYGLHAFTYGSKKADDGVYMSVSLTWNPAATDKVSHDPHQATLGSTKYEFGSASQYDRSQSMRDTYNDTLAFRERTPLSRHGAIDDLINSFERTLVRSRISALMGGRSEPTKFQFGWHNDELIFMNLRVNIPIVSSANYVIQTILGEVDGRVEIAEKELIPGNAYVYDTKKNHRPCCKVVTDKHRVNMIVGVCPWFDFDDEQQAWVSNDYYGTLHPFEMFSMGLISPLIKSS